MAVSALFPYGKSESPFLELGNIRHVDIQFNGGPQSVINIEKDEVRIDFGYNNDKSHHIIGSRGDSINDPSREYYITLDNVIRSVEIPEKGYCLPIGMVHLNNSGSTVYEYQLATDWSPSYDHNTYIHIAYESRTFNERGSYVFFYVLSILQGTVYMWNGPWDSDLILGSELYNPVVRVYYLPLE